MRPLMGVTCCEAALWLSRNLALYLMNVISIICALWLKPRFQSILPSKNNDRYIKFINSRDVILCGEQWGR